MPDFVKNLSQVQDPAAGFGFISAGQDYRIEKLVLILQESCPVPGSSNFDESC
jgi:hypothetical protein